jgi:hypothetical protein
MSTPYHTDPEASVQAARGLQRGTALIVQQLEDDNDRLRAKLKEIVEHYDLNTEPQAWVMAGISPQRPPSIKAPMMVEWKPAGTAPKTGCMVRTRKGLTMRWIAYKEGSEQHALGEEGRWQVLTRKGNWSNAVIEPGEWRGANMPPKREV